MKPSIENTHQKCCLCNQVWLATECNGYDCADEHCQAQCTPCGPTFRIWLAELLVEKGNMEITDAKQVVNSLTGSAVVEILDKSITDYDDTVLGMAELVIVHTAEKWLEEVVAKHG